MPLEELVDQPLVAGVLAISSTCQRFIKNALYESASGAPGEVRSFSAR
jgi:hypothetical protein